ncbi:MAG: DUF3622 domain-containing protein [Gammaproteobacteria bacterium]|nr:DUF3622 domain-containing protein [Gammaproteobacteria bacterium]
MAQSKKFNYRIVKNGDTWRAEITRRATSKKTLVSKKQGGFASEAEAREWGEKELASFLKNLVERNRRHSEKRDYGTSE